MYLFKHTLERIVIIAGMIKRLFEYAKKELFDMGLTREQFKSIRIPVAEDNRRLLMAWSIYAALFWIMSLFMSLKSEAYAACRIVYSSSLVCDFITFITATVFVKRFPQILSFITRFFEISILCAGVGIALCQPDVRTVTMIAFGLIVPTTMIDRTITDMIMEIGTIILYMTVGSSIIRSDIFSWGLTNLIIFSSAGVMIGHVINKSRFERYLYAESAKKLADVQMRYAYYDQLTGLRNRRAYSEELNVMEKSRDDNFCIVMADLNGLKKMNDTLGHAAGDELIIYAAKCLNDTFPGENKVYRIGGDEFCVITKGNTIETLRRLMEMDKNAKELKGEYINGVSISYGVASNQESSDVHSVVKIADKRMYDNKREFHNQTDQNAGERCYF